MNHGLEEKNCTQLEYNSYVIRDSNTLYEVDAAGQS